MSVLLETSKGDLVVDLYTDECPKASKNFLKLCKIKYYNNVLFHTIIRDFIAQTGDPTGTGTGGESINGILYGEQARFFEDEIRPNLRHKKRGTVAMAGGGKDMNASQFYFTTGVDLDSLDDKHTIFGEVSEGLDVLAAINEAFVDEANRPLQNVRIRHTVILDDPFPDPPQLDDHIPEQSPPPEYTTGGDRLEDDWVPTEDTRDPEVVADEEARAEAEKRAEVLEMVGDLPSADAKPPPNMVFVCKLNPVTTEEDLEIIFSRFGTITSCDIIRDWKTGDSLCYAFIGFDTDKAAENAFFKMDNVLIDDRRIHVDFSQSMHHLWRQFKVFGKAGSAEAGAEANAKDQSRRGPPGHLELKPGASRGLFAGPSAAGRSGRGYELVHEDDGGGSAPGPSGRDRDRHHREPGDARGHGGRSANGGRSAAQNGGASDHGDGRRFERESRGRDGGRSAAEASGRRHYDEREPQSREGGHRGGGSTAEGSGRRRYDDQDGERRGHDRRDEGRRPGDEEQRQKHKKHKDEKKHKSDRHDREGHRHNRSPGQDRSEKKSKRHKHN